MLNIQKKRRSWALYFAGFLLVIQLASVVIPVTHVHANTIDPGGGTAAPDASPYGQDSVTAKAEKWVLARAVAECLAGNSLGSNSPDKVFGGGNTQVGEYAARLVEGASSDDATSSCNSVWTKAHNALGWDMEDTLCTTFGFTRAGGGCPNGTGNYLPPNKTNSFFVDKWNELVRTQYLGDKTLQNALTGGMRYWIYFGEFKQKCGDDNGGGLTAYPWTGDNQPTSDNNSYRITSWYKDGDVQDSYVVADKGTKDWDVNISGYGLMGVSGDKIKCREIAKNLSTLGSIFKDELAADATAGRTQSASSGALSSGSTSDRENSCEASNGALAWMGCAILEVMDGIIGFLDSQIRSLLTVQTDALDQGGGLKKAWGIMRNFAYLVLVPMMLLMVIGTAVGFGPFDAYTVKKALPRMVSAVIFMSISYYLCLFLINVSNDVGKGIFNLITLAAPGGQVNSLTDVFGAGAGGLFTGLSTAGVIAGLATETITWGILGSFALVTAVALLIGYVILVVRQVLIIMLLVLSPLAILVWIFPGNDKLWTIWKTTFIAMLMMFPLIMLLIASGRFFAATADTTYQGLTGTFIKLIAYVAPYFFIPATFKYGLGIFGNIAGMVNDRGRGIFDRQRKKRQETYAEGMSNFKTGGGYRNTFSRSRATSRIGQGVGVGIRGRGGFGSRGQGAIDLMSRVSQADRLKDPRMQQLAYDDDANAAMYLSGGSESSARGRLKQLGWDDDRINRAVGTAKQIGISRANSMAAMQSGAQNKFRAIWENPDAMKLLRDSAVEASDGNQQLVDNTMGSIEFSSRQAGNYHLGASSASSPTGANLESAWKKAGLYQHANGTGQSMKAFGDYHVNNFKSGNLEQRRKAAIALLEMQNMLPSATGENQNVINATLQSAGIDFNKGTTVQQQIYELGKVSEGPDVITLRDLNGQARVYDREDERIRRAE